MKSYLNATESMTQLTPYRTEQHAQQTEEQQITNCF